MPRRTLPVVLFACLALAGAPAELRAESDAPCASETPWIEIAGGIAAEGGVGGTGRGTPHEGIGGTGRGTPHEGVGGTGIYGTITGFGSICVNGERVHYDDDVPVEHGADARTAGDLALGQRVWVIARDDGGELRAESIAIVPAARGRVMEVDSAVERFQVEGRWVWLTDETVLVADDGQPTPRTALAGRSVTVFGLEDPAGDLIATRIEVHEQGDEDAAPVAALEDPLAQRHDLQTLSVEGIVLERAEDRVRVGPVWVVLPEDGPVVENGARLWLRGSITRDRVIRPDRIQVRPARPLRARPEVAMRLQRDAGPSVAAARPRNRVARQARAERPGQTRRANRPGRAERPDAPESPDAPRAVRPTAPDRIDRPDRANVRPARDAHRVSAARRAQTARRAARAARRAAKRAAKRDAKR